MKLLVILPRFPYPTEKGDKLRAFNQLKVLSEHFDISLFALSHDKVSPENIEKVKPFCKSIHIERINFLQVVWNLFICLFTSRPLQVGYYYTNKAKRAFRKKIKEVNPDHIYCQLLRTAPYAFGIEIPKTLDYQDVFSKGIERRIPGANYLTRIILKLEWKRLLKFEALVFDIFDNKTIISKPDRDCIPHAQKDQIVIIPNGVDQQYFKPLREKKTTDFVFTGNMGYPPNVDCAEYLVNKVMPIIRQKYPDAKITLAGATPHARVKALAGNKVIVTGWVDDIREYYSTARIFMAPMQLGTGLQNKLLEAMAMRLPCVTSSLCNSALMARENEEIMIGNNATEVAQQAIKLMEDQQLADKIALNGLSFIKLNYTWQGATNKLAFLIKETNKVPGYKI